MLGSALVSQHELPFQCITNRPVKIRVRLKLGRHITLSIQARALMPESVPPCSQTQLVHPYMANNYSRAFGSYYPTSELFLA